MRQNVNVKGVVGSARSGNISQTGGNGGNHNGERSVNQQNVTCSNVVNKST